MKSLVCFLLLSKGVLWFSTVVVCFGSSLF